MAEKTNKRTMRDYVAKAAKADKSEKKRFEVALEAKYNEKLQKVKEHYNIAKDADWLRITIDFQYDEIMN